MNIEYIDYRINRGDTGNVPKLIVIHAMGEFIEGGDRDLHAPAFLDKIGLSVHCFVTPSGGLIKSREDTEVAWHAKPFNRNSLGIEFLLPGVHNSISLHRITKMRDWVSEQQYQAGLMQIQDWCDRWPIEKIAMHYELAPARKTDPGIKFPKDRLLNEVRM